MQTITCTTTRACCLHGCSIRLYPPVPGSRLQVPDDNIFNIGEANKLESILTRFRDAFLHLKTVYEEGVKPVDTLMKKLLAHYDKDATGAAPMQIAPPDVQAALMQVAQLQAVQPAAMQVAQLQAVQAAVMRVAQPQGGVEETKVRHLLRGQSF
jgi:hypothetical protein